jgi:hypothetical protein
MSLEMARMCQNSPGPSASLSSASSAPTLMSLANLSLAPTTDPAIFCAPQGDVPPPGYAIIQDYPLHVWFALANLGPEALEEAIFAWSEAGLGDKARAVLLVKMCVCGVCGRYLYICVWHLCMCVFSLVRM